MADDLSTFTIHELQALVEQGMPIADYEAELKRRASDEAARPAAPSSP